MLFMAAKIAAGSALAAEFHALDNLEQQTMFLIATVAGIENEYNSANPDNLQNKATVAVNYDQKTCTGQLTLALADQAVNGRLVDGTLAYLP